MHGEAGAVPPGLLRKQAALAAQNAARQSLALILGGGEAMEALPLGGLGPEGSTLGANPLRLDLDLKEVSRIISEQLSWDQALAEVHATLDGLEGGRLGEGTREGSLAMGNEVVNEATFGERYGIETLLSPRKRR